MSNSAFVPKSVKSFRLVRQLGSTHHSQKSVLVNSEPRLAPLIQIAKEKLFENELSENGNLEISLFHHTEFGLDEINTQEDINKVIKRYGKHIPTLKVDIKSNDSNELNGTNLSNIKDISTKNLFDLILKNISESDDQHNKVASSLLNNSREMERIYNLFLNSCRYMIPTSLEKNTLAIWRPSMEKFIQSTLLHHAMAQNRQMGDSAVFGSSFSLKRIDDKPLKINTIPQAENGILAGPVFGALNPDRTLRLISILKRGEQEQEMFISFVPSNQLEKEVISQPIKVKSTSLSNPFIVQTIEVKNLQPSTPYVTIWTGFFNSDDGIAQLDTLPSKLSIYKVAILPTISSQSGSAYRLVEEARPNIVLHIGHTNVSNSWTQAEQVLSRYGSSFNSKDVAQDDRIAIRNIFRNHYITQWKEKQTHSILSKFSNYFGFSRSSIRSDFGARPEDYTLNSKYFFIAEQARFVYWELQRDLNESFISKLNDSYFRKHEGSFYTLGNSAFLFVDTVTAGTFLRAYGIEDGSSWIGREQWNYIDNILNQSNTIEQFNVILETDFLLNGDQEASQLLTILQAWKKQGLNREISIISSGFGGESEYKIVNSSNAEIANLSFISSQDGSDVDSIGPEFVIGGQYAARRKSASTKSAFSIVQSKAGKPTISKVTV